MNWKSLTSTQDVLDLAERSKVVPCLIFKHSTSCPISSIARMRLEGDWSFPAENPEPYFLDLLRYRQVSHFIAEHFAVHHESPQILLIKDGMCVYDNSHLDISIAELAESL
ncbi:MAG: bacillithiol system redox-active protein YtxJ [Bacteroidota bacterium]